GAGGLRRLGLISAEHGPLLGRLVTQVTLPALIFSTLATTRLAWSESMLAGVMLLAEAACLGLAWLAARALRLDGPRTGALLLASAFGSSTMLGYPLVASLFPADPGAMAEAVIISELGDGPAIFTLGVMAAILEGGMAVTRGARLKEAGRYFISPIFVSVAAGMLCSALGPLDRHGALAMLFDVLDVAARANTFVVVLTVGALLHFRNLREAVGPAVAACLVLLVAQPLLVWAFSLPLDVDAGRRLVLVLESAMPSALLSVPLATRYGCDGTLASRLVLATALASVVTVPLMLGLLG
ncbi:MAG: AEC family transporter, partial [Desulfovibrionaceae bacterium]